MKWIIVSDNHGEQGILHELYDYHKAVSYTHLTLPTN